MLFKQRGSLLKYGPFLPLYGGERGRLSPAAEEAVGWGGVMRLFAEAQTKCVVLCADWGI